MSKLRYFFQESWLLMTASVVFGVLLAVTNAAWDPKIKQNEIDKFSDLAKGLLPAAEKFEPLPDKITVNIGGGKTVDADVRRGLDASGKCVGWAFLCQGSGFGDKIKMVATADAKFETLTGFGVLACSETPGFGDKITIKNGFFQSQFIGAPAERLSLVKIGDNKKIDGEIVAITGATVTSQAVVNILNTFMVPIKEQLRQKGLLQ